jgi:23S rRNA pseudouridine1911/1915/1917 synthase
LPGANPNRSEPDAEGARYLEAGAELAGLRVDRALALAFPDLSRSRLQGLIEGGDVTVNGTRTKPSNRIRTGDRLCLVVPPPALSHLVPERADLRIVYEDESLLVVAKAAGVVVHPGAGQTSGTLAAALLDHCGALSQIGGVTRPGIVHRLDKGTSGLLVVAKSDRAHTSLSEQFKSRTVTKIYTGICVGTPRPSHGSVKLAIGRDVRNRKRMAVVAEGRAAHTDYAVTEMFERAASVLRLTLHTGRTHQIRVHLAALGCPLVGDTTYGSTTMAARCPEAFRHILSDFPRPALHAQVLAFAHPVDGRAMSFEEPWPDDLAALREQLRAVAPTKGGPRRG